jgi:hypothetical protein
MDTFYEAIGVLTILLAFAWVWAFYFKVMWLLIKHGWSRL